MKMFDIKNLITNNWQLPELKHFSCLFSTSGYDLVLIVHTRADQLCWHNKGT